MSFIIRNNITKVIKCATKRKSFLRFSSTACKKTEDMDDLKKNPYFEKYAGKIAELQKTSPEEFLARINAHEKFKTKKSNEPARQFTPLLKPKDKLKSESNYQNEPLDKIMKTELIKDKNAEEIKVIWHEYHAQKDVICAVLPLPDFNTMMEEANKYPIFLFPLPRSQGYEFIMSQFSGCSVHFTPLICYQVHKENAPECLTIRYYTDIKDEKGIVLMRGEYDKNVINGKEAQCLGNQLQLYYGKTSKEKSDLLEEFTLRPDNFKHMSLIKQIEDIQLT